MIYLFCGLIAGGIVGSIWTKKIAVRLIKKEKKGKESVYSNYQMLHRLLLFYETGEGMGEYLKKHNYNRIAVYGAGIVGKHFISAVKKTNIEVAYAIDRYKSGEEQGVKIISLEDEMDEVDAMIVTPIYLYGEIKQELLEVIDCPILSMEELFDE